MNGSPIGLEVATIMAGKAGESVGESLGYKLVASRSDAGSVSSTSLFLSNSGNAEQRSAYWKGDPNEEVVDLVLP